MTAFSNLTHKTKFLKDLFNYKKNNNLNSISLSTNPDKKNEIYEILNPNNLDEEMIKIIYNMKNAGYKIGLFSNIDEDSLQWLANKNQIINSLLKEFDLKIITSKENNYLKKSDPKAFDNCKEKINQQLGEGFSPVLIDDSIEKINIAKTKNYKTYHFKTISEFKKYIKKVAPKIDCD